MWRCTRRAGLRAIGAIALGLRGAAHAQERWPSRPITLVVGYAAGGGSDTVARLVAPRMAELLGQSVLVDNRPGAAGQLAAAYVARSPADGYTLLVDASSFCINLGLGLKLSYSAQSFATVGLLAFFPLVVVVYPGFPAKSMADLIALAKAKPRTIFYASAGNGSIQQIVGAMLMQATGIEITHVPYKGAAPALNDLMGGQVQIFFANAAAALPLIKSGKLRALAVTGDHRLTLLPGVPTLAETPANSMNLREWNGMFAPAATSPAIIDRVASALHQALVDPDVVKRIGALSGEAFTGDRQQAQTFISNETVAMGKVIRERGIKVE